MTEPFAKTLTVYADGVALTPGYTASLTARSRLSLRPSFSVLTLRALSDGAAAYLARAKTLRVESGASVLASGAVADVYRDPAEDGAATVATFSPELPLWEAPVSLTVRAGVKYSDAVRLVLRACGAGTELVSFTGDDRRLFRGAAFLGRAADAVTELAAAAGADAFLTPAGLRVQAPPDPSPAPELRPEDLTGPVSSANGLIILPVSAGAWPMGAYVACGAYAGRLIACQTDADTAGGLWKTRLFLAP